MLSQTDATPRQSQLTATPPKGQQLRRALIVYLAALAFFWATGLIGAYARSRIMHVANPFDCLWVYDGMNSHVDVKGYNPKTQGFGAPGFERVMVYPAPLMCVYVFLTGVASRPVEAYTGFVIVLGVAVAVLFAAVVSRFSRTNKTLITLAALVSVVLNYPLWFTIERSNLEAVVWVAVLIGCVALITRWYKTAAVFVALAAAMKLYPGILLLVFLKEKRYRDLALCCVFFAAINVLGLWVLNPDLLKAHGEVTTGLTLLNKTHVSEYLPREIGFDHSFFSPVKHAFAIFDKGLFATDKARFSAKIAAAIRIYTLLALPGFAIAYLLWIRKLPLINQVAVLLILSITLPMMSLEYTLMQIFPVIAILLLFLAQAANRGRSIPVGGVYAALISFAIVISPFSWLAGRTAGYGAQVKLLALIALLVFACRFPLERAHDLMARLESGSPNGSPVTDA